MTPRIEAIKDAFRGCTSVPEVNACAKDHGEEVSALKADPATRVGAIQIENLAAYKRLVLIHHK
ncbi:hypothetical protein [Leisingera daeponensis]|uniref:hypothetical protein n=1 Tax=Leisingera daeponensis TaxID=405746 RepID=UPI001C967C24|nr:hypothetical protein [Leisingera daeponensis]MBY6055351.1 hypothetical protein [Leisingera daeponensis]